MSFVRHAKKVMVITHYLLIRTDEHYGQIIRLPLYELVQFQNRLDVVQIHELVNNTVGITGNIT